MQVFAVRLTPDQDLKVELDRIAAIRSIEAACVLTCVGSLRKAVLRYANQSNTVELAGFFEIVSLTGTFSRHGSHFHIAIADSDGKTWGAHLLEGSAIYTTAEIVIGILPGIHLLRTQDPRTGYPELEILAVS